MRAKKLTTIKQRFEFEAKVVDAKPKANSTVGNETEHTTLNLNDFLAPNPEKIFLVQVNGESMIDEGIFDGDILIVNKDEMAEEGKIVIASLNGELTVKTFRIVEGQPYLFSANKKFLPIKIEEFYEFRIQGVVKHVIKKI